MKVRVVLSIDVDPDEWRAEYGDPTMTNGDIRDAIRRAAADAARTDGVIAPAGIIREVTEQNTER